MEMPNKIKSNQTFERENKSSRAKICHDEIVKFGLILTYLKLFSGQTGGRGGGKNAPMPPCGAATQHIT